MSLPAFPVKSRNVFGQNGARYGDENPHLKIWILIGCILICWILFLQELARVEEEITTLRTVLTSKVRHASELKRKLGITVWREISDDMNQSLKNVRESHVFQKTESALKTTAEKTGSILGGLTSGITNKLSQMKKSDSYRSIEERVGSAYENVKVCIAEPRIGI